MNTVFKFYFQAWGLLSIAAGCGMYFLFSVPSSGSRKDIDSRRFPTGKVYPPNPNGSSGNALWNAFWPKGLLSTLKSKRLFPRNGNMLWIIGLLISHIPFAAFLLASLNPLQFAQLIGKIHWFSPSILLEVPSAIYPILWGIGLLISLIPVMAFLLRTLNPQQPWQLVGRTYWFYTLLLLLVASTVYPLLAPSSRLQMYSTAPQAHSGSLDGLNYLEYYRPFDLGSETHPTCTIDVGGDYYAIRWINSHIQGDPVMVEGIGDVKNGTVGNGYDYTTFSRVSAFTGLPTLMGWSGHEVQWRLNWLKNPANSQSFSERIEAVDTIYTSPNPQQVLATMKRYNAQYLYVGSMECQQYTGYNFPRLGTIDLQRFGAFMQVVYAEHGVTIYKVK
jgi:hypothetical protein